LGLREEGYLREGAFGKDDQETGLDKGELGAVVDDEEEYLAAGSVAYDDKLSSDFRHGGVREVDIAWSPSKGCGVHVIGRPR
jgi:hypothetical protein